MGPLAQLSPSGRLARGPFAFAAVAVYAASFASQALLAPPVAAKAGLWAFAVAQAVLVWAWYLIHAQRLRDAGRETGAALGIAIVYALAIVLLLLLLLLTAGGSGGADNGAPLFHFFVIVTMLALLTGDQALGTGFGYFVIAFLALIFAPIVIALGFSLHTALRPSTPPAP
jgi:uncharacterized membrane protein YhaH (DUF805 family)